MTENNATETSSPFFLHLARKIGATEAKNTLRICNKGLFVSEDFAEQLAEHYQHWLKEQTGKDIQKASDKYIRKFFGSEQPKTFYLLDGKECFAGMIATESASLWKDIKPSESYIARYQGELLDPENFLHPKDPMLSKVEGVKIEFDPRKGSFFSFAGKKNVVKIENNALVTFSKLLRELPEVKKKFPKFSIALRETLEPIKTILREAKPLPRKLSRVIPAELAKKNPSLALSWGSITILLDKDSHLIGSFLSRGKSSRKMLETEVKALETKAPLTSIRGFTLNKQLGKIRARDLSLKLSPLALSQFIRLLTSRNNTKKPLPPFITANDVIFKLVSILTHAKDADEALRKELLQGRSPGNRLYRVSGGWIFLITDKTDLASCFRVRNQKSESTNKRAVSTEPLVHTS